MSGKSLLPEADQACFQASTSKEGSTVEKNANGLTNKDLIVISDSELEEGEIDLNDSDEYDDIKTKEHPEIKPPRKSSNIKDRLSFLDRSSSFEEDYDDNNDHDEDGQSFKWSELNVLLIGDESAPAYNWQEWKDFPVLEIYHKPYADTMTLCSLANQHLHKHYDVLVLMAFHYDFVCNVGTEYLTMKENIDFEGIILTLLQFHTKWRKEYPDTSVVWILPHPIDFFTYNSFLNTTRKIALSSLREDELSMKYYEATVMLSRRINCISSHTLKDIIFFDLSDVIFEKHPHYEKTFQSGHSPKFPEGLLKYGIQPTRMMVLNFVFLLIEYILHEGLYPENKRGLDIKKAEKQLIKFHPEFKQYLYDFRERASQYKRISSQRYASTSQEERSFSFDSDNRSYRSRSSSPKRRKSSGRKPRSKSPSSRRKRKHHQRSHHRKRKRRRSRSSSSEASNADSRSLVESVPSPLEKQSVEAVPAEKPKTKPDESKYMKSFQYLCDCHEIQCNYYRENPTRHPMYQSERQTFLHKMARAYVQDGKSETIDWDTYWVMRMEELFKESWTLKKRQLRKDLKKPLNIVSKDSDDITNQEESMEFVLPKDINAIQESAAETTPSTTTENSAASSPVPVDEVAFDIDETKCDKDLKEELFFAEVSASNDKDSVITSAVDQTVTDENVDSNTEKNMADQPESNSVITEAATKADVADSEKEDSDVDIDFDFDKILEDPMVLQGLEDIDGDLQDILAHETDEPETKNEVASIIKNEDVDTTNKIVTPTAVEDISTTRDESLPTKPLFAASMHPSMSSVGQKQQQQQKHLQQSSAQNGEKSSQFLHILKLLCKLSKRLGPYGPLVTTLYNSALDHVSKGKDPLGVLESDTQALFDLVLSHLRKHLNGELSEVQRAVLIEVSERLNSFLSLLALPSDKFADIPIKQIAQATIGQEASKIIPFIKTIINQKYSYSTSKDIMNVYMAVREAHLKMIKK